MRPRNSGTPRQRSSILESGLALSITVWPTSRFMILLSGMICSSRMASISTLVDQSSVARWLSQIGIAAEFLAHELLQQQFADRFERGIGQQQFGAPAAVFHVDAQLDQDGGIGGARDRREARIGLQPVELEIDRRQGLEGLAHVLKDHLDHALDERALDGGVGPSLDAHGRGAAPSAQKHVDDGIDEVGIHREQAVIVQLFGVEHGQDRRQRDRIQVIAETDGGDVVQAHFDIVRGEIAQATSSSAGPAGRRRFPASAGARRRPAPN